MKKLFFPTLIALAFIACNDSAGGSSAQNAQDSTAIKQEMKEERNKETALASLKAFSGETSVESVFKNADKDLVDYGSGEMPAMKGVDSAKAGLQTWLNAVPDYKGSDFIAVADGDYVMVYGTWTGTWKNNMMGMDATKKSFKVNDVDIFKFNEEGKIIEHRGTQSVNETARQIGMKMP